MSEAFRIFENMQDVAFVIDEQMNVHFGNGAAGLLLDISARRLSSGKPLVNFVEFSPDLLEESLETVDEPTQMREIRFTTSEGKEGWAQVSVQLLPAPLLSFLASESGVKDLRRWVVYLRDVSLEKTLHEKYKGELDKKEAVIEDLRKAQAELANYSKNLERMVEERTRELRETNRLLATILDSLGQGILVFDRSGTCLPVFSKICEKMFGLSPAGRSVADLLRLDGVDRAMLDKWIEAIFAEMLSFDDLVPLGPSKLMFGDRHVALDFQPMRDERKALHGMVLVATDKTEEMKARQDAERERGLARRIVRIIQHRQQFRMFVSEAERICDDSIAVLRSERDIDGEELARHLHTIKGGAASFSLTEIAEVAHRCEDSLTAHLRMRTPSGPWPLVLRDELASGIETMQRMLADFLQQHAFLAGAAVANGERLVEIPATVLAEWYRRLQDPSAALRLSGEILESWVREPVSKAFLHIDDSLQDLAKSLGKRLKTFKVEGGDLRVLPESFSDLFPTFIHAFRNAVDHGIETPEERSAAGKDPEGRISIRFTRVEETGARWLKVEINDDGRGIDPARIRTRLADRSLPFDANASDDEVVQAVFRDDFSTAAAVTEISGRGVGLAAIKRQAEKMGGWARMHSSLGSGSVLTVMVPEPNESTAGGDVRVRSAS